MSLFTPPVLDDNPMYNVDCTPAQYQLYRFYKPLPRYVCVYLLSDGSVVQDTPTSGHDATNIPLPYDPNNPNLPFATSYSWDFTIGQPVKTETSHSVWITQIFQGPTEVDAPTAALLSAAGYTLT